LLDLGALMGLSGILDCQGMEPELIPETEQQFQIRFVKADPDHVTGLVHPLSRFIDWDIGNSLAFQIDATGHHPSGLGDVAGSSCIFSAGAVVDYALIFMTFHRARSSRIGQSGL
jgi:hypothetical protein